MINRYLTFFFLIMIVGGSSFAQTSIEGKVIDIETGEPILFGDVALYKNGVLITGGQTDFDGNYSISNLDGGTYDVEASYVGYSAKRTTNVTLTNGRVTRVDFQLGQGIDLDVIEIVEYKKPLIDIDNTSSGGALTSDDIENLPTKNINALASLTAGLSSTDGGAINARGSRSSGTDYYLDGIRVSGSLIPQSEIEQLTTLIGGIPASYGDVTGAVISLTSKGPSNRVSGGLEVETSEFLDEFGYNLVSANISGPILKNSENHSVIGFRLSGQYTYREDDGPTATGVYRSTEEFISRHEADPINDLDIVLSEYDLLERNGGSLQLLETRPNQEDEDINLTAKLDFRIAGNVDISISGNYIDSKNRFSPSSAWNAYNWTRNPYDNDITYRGNFRLKHRLGGRQVADDTGARTISAIRNVSYTITGGYQHNEGDVEDLIHGQRMFEYGYVGDFDVQFNPSLGFNIETGGFEHIGYNRVTVGYTPNSAGINPAWLALNKGVEDGNIPGAVTSFNAYNGERNELFRSAWGYHTTPGAVYNRISKDESDRYTVDVRTNFDFIPGGSEKGRHSIQIGFLYEQRESRSWRINPQQLYSEARVRVNQPLFGSGVDSLTIVDSIPDPLDPFGNQLPVFAPVVAGGVQNNLHKNLRDALSIGYNEYVNIDAIAPGDMRLEWFEPEELTENLLYYYGYDYLGNRLGSDVTFDDFFADRDGNEKQDFVVASFQPNYLSAFIQDKFSFKDIIFRLGVRMERYDANTKVLKDPYSLYEIMTADEFAQTTGQTLPEVVQNDYKVYVQNADSDRAIGFRNGEQWYSASGAPVNDGTLIFGSGGSVQPYYKIRDSDERNIQNKNYVNNLDGSFEDYDPEINFAPRLSFSFPISEASNFFANYDILYQRPTSGVLNTALDYYYFEENAASNDINSNPNLKPVQTTSYEIGFNQKISNSSALRIQAYYKEERNRVQARTLQQVASPIGSYTTFDNIDFATIKGFSFTYDLRRTGNVLALANYTLQFADGTGSNPQSQRTLSSTGQNIRTLSALDFDERHRFNLTVDYRYGQGKKYNGPQVFGADIFSNAGANLQVTAVSGQPYTKADLPTAFGGTGFSGGLNESRLPWISTVDLKVDKDFTLFAGEESKRPLSFNVYLRVQNLMNTKNVRGVYTFTGDAESSGFLAHPRGRDLIEGTANGEANGRGTVVSLLDLYEARALAPGFYTLPRRIYLGAYFNF